MTQLLASRWALFAARIHSTFTAIRRKPAAGLLVAMLLLPGAAFADESSGNTDPVPRSARGLADSSVALHNGSFTSEIAFDLPAYRSNTPNLSLVYSSAAGNGFAGVGWSLEGFSTIERASPGRGSPRYGVADADDIYLLDGEELVPWPALGAGYYATKRQRFVRIVDTGAGWEVRRPDGTVQRYTPIMSLQGETFRWGRTQVTGPGGRDPVNYSWYCPSTAIANGQVKDCYPRQISYANVVVSLSTETRLDQETFATGYLLAKTELRLSSVDVRVNGTRLRKYDLAYHPYSARTGRSLLKSVKQYGLETGSLSLPATTMTWSSSTSGFANALQVSAVPGGLTLQQWQYSDLYNADFNGDGRTDLLMVHKWGSTDTETKAFLLLAKTTGGGFQDAKNITDLYGMSRARWHDFRNPTFADFNGDGRPEILYFYYDNNTFRKTGLLKSAPPSADGTINDNNLFLGTTEITTQFGMTRERWDSSPDVFDYNGDGRADLLVTESSALGYWKRLLIGNSANTFSPVVDVTNAWGMNKDLWLSDITFGDFNGDGRTDMFLRRTFGVNPPHHLYLLMAQPNDTYSFENVTNQYGIPTANFFSGIIQVGDFNGDGRSDLFINRQAGISLPRYLLLANGSDGTLGYTSGDSAFQDAVDITDSFGMSDRLWDTAEIVPGDYNGDGHTDLFIRSTYTVSAQDPMLMLYGRTEGFADAVDVTDSYGMSVEKWGKADYRVGDYNGDGVDDLLVHSFRGTALDMQHLMLYGAGLPGDLLTAMANGYGGTTTISYVPSSHWNNTANPPVSQTVKSFKVADGFAWSMTTEYEYSGGAWDASERRHLGFRYVKEKDPTGAFRETYFFLGKTYQLGEVEEFVENDAAGTDLRWKKRYMSAASAAAPWARLVLRLEEWEHNGALAPKQKITDYEYDDGIVDGDNYDSPYGNRTRTVEYGDMGYNGDERNTQVVYRPNATDYLVDYPAEVIVRAGSLLTGTTLSHQRFHYDGQAHTAWPTRGDVTRDEKWLNTTGAFIGKTFTYDPANGNMLSQTDALGRTTSYEWATDWGLFSTRHTNALAHVRSTTWDAVCGVKDQETDENGNVTNTDYDALCRPIDQYRPDGGRTHWDYAAFGTTGQYTKETIYDGVNPTGAFKISYFDGLGRIYLSHNNLSEYVETDYDPRGLVLQVSAPYSQLLGETPRFTRYTYDALQRIRTRQAPDHTVQSPSIQHILYEGWRTTTCDELGKPRTETRDAYGQIRQVNEYIGLPSTPGVCVMDPGGVVGTSNLVTTIDYDLLGRRVGHKDAKNNTASSTYDSLGRMVSRNDPDLGIWSYAYDDAGNLHNRSGPETDLDYFYDPLDRLKQVSWRLDMTTYTVVRNTYDCTGLAVCVNGIGRLQVSSRDVYKTNSLKTVHSVSYEYDEGGRKTLESRSITGYSLGKTGWVKGTGRTYDTRRTWDAAGRVRTLVYPGGEVVTHGYDVLGRSTSLTSSTRGAIVSAATYDARGHVVTRTLGSGLVENFGYHANRFWLTGLNAKLGTSVRHAVSFDRNNRGEVINRRNGLETKDNWDYEYDDLRRLTKATNLNNPSLTETFQYDSIGRMTFNSTKGAYEYGSFATTGTPLHAPRLVGTGNPALVYDGSGNLTSGDGTTLQYDVDGKPVLINSTTLSYDGEGTRTTVGSVDTVGEVYEKDLSNSAATTYYFFGDVRIAQSGASGMTYLHGDQLNSAATITDGSGTVLEKQVLSPYGRRLTTVTKTAIGLAGQRLDSTGLYHMGAREMSPALGIFVTPDPSDAPNPERPQTLNRYAYANNSPTNLVDPTGYSAEESESTYDKVSFWTHTTLSVLGAVPVLGVIPDAIDLVYTAVEVPFGKSSYTDLALAGAGVAATFVPVVGDGAAAVGKNVARVAQRELRQQAAEAAAAAARRTAKGPCGKCFVAGTLVLTASGLKAIEDIRPGDMVASRYDESGVSEFKPVVGLSGMESEPVIAVVLADPTGRTERIEVTADHPFMTAAGWKDAGEIAIGDAVKSYSGRELKLVERIDLRKSVRTYNFEVADSHSYFVGYSGAWVHNATPCPLPGYTSSPALKGDPYHPDVVDARIKPPMRPNEAHDQHSPLFNPRKTPEPGDAASAYRSSVRGNMHTWYGKNSQGRYYQFFDDNAGAAHFSGTVSRSEVPNSVLKILDKK